MGSVRVCVHACVCAGVPRERGRTGPPGEVGAEGRRTVSKGNSIGGCLRLWGRPKAAEFPSQGPGLRTEDVCAPSVPERDRPQRLS